MHRLRDRSLVTGRWGGGGGGWGGYKTGGRGAIQVLPPTKRWGAEKVLAMLKGGHRKFEVVLTGET